MAHDEATSTDYASVLFGKSDKELARLQAADEKNWVLNGGSFPSVVFFAHYFPFTLISARDLLSNYKKWSEEKESSEAMLLHLRGTTPKASLLTPRNYDTANTEFHIASRIAEALGMNGAEVGAGIDGVWNPFRKDIVGASFEIISFLHDCGVSSDYINDEMTTVISALKDWVSFFNDFLSCGEDVRTFNEDCTLEELLEAVTELDDKSGYKDTVMNYLNALSILQQKTDTVYFTDTGVYTSRGVSVRFLVGHMKKRNTVLGCFQVLYLS